MSGDLVGQVRVDHLHQAAGDDGVVREWSHYRHAGGCSRAVASAVPVPGVLPNGTQPFSAEAPMSVSAPEPAEVTRTPFRPGAVP